MSLRRCTSLLVAATFAGLTSSAIAAATIEPQEPIEVGSSWDAIAATDTLIAVTESDLQTVRLWRRAPTSPREWVPDGEISAPGAMTWGWQLAFAGDGQLLVGMPYGRPDSRVDVVESTAPGQWRLVQSIVVEDFVFGGALVAHGDRFATVEAGASGHVDQVVVYRRVLAGWELETRLPVEEPPPLGWWWVTLRLGDDILVCGLGDIPGAQVLVFEHDGRQWERTAHLHEPLDSEGYGWTFALHDDLLAVGVPGARRGKATGAVDLYRRDGSGEWLPVGELVAAGEGAHPYLAGFGSSLTFLPDGRLMVGAPGGGTCIDFDCAYRASRLHLFTPPEKEPAAWKESSRWVGRGDSFTVFPPPPPPEDQLGGRLFWDKDQLLTPAATGQVRVFGVGEQ
jgi:hypothetical protein